LSKRHPLFLFIAFVLFLCNAQPCTADSHGADRRLFQNLALDAASKVTGKALTRGQMVINVNFDLLREEKRYAPDLLLDIFEKSIQVTQTRVIKRTLSSYTWIGKVDNAPLSNVLLTVDDKIMFGRIEYAGSVYKIEPVGNGIFHRIIKLDPTKIMPFDDDVLIPPQNIEPRDGVSQNALPDPPIASLYDGSVIDIMFLYTDGMAAAYPGNQIITKINELVDLTNQAYTNSQVNTMLNVVKTQQVSYADGGSLNTALTELIDGTGVFSNLATLRNQYAADIVALLRKYQTSNNSCGLAYVMQTVSSSFASLAFSVTQEGRTEEGFRCSDYALAHEVGHNLGSVHDRANATINGAYSYSYGYDVPGVFGTIMSYEGPVIGYFSNPDITYNGYSIGVPEGQSDSADNAKSMRNTIATVAGFRDSSDRDTTQPTLTIDSPCSSSCSTSSLSITVSGTVEDSGGSELERVSVTSGANEWNDYSVSGDSDTFSVTGISLNQDQNIISAQAYDNSGNSSDVYTIYVTYNPPCTDNDNDGYSTEGGTCGLVDCDDNDPDSSPGSSETCSDTKDNDCDGLIDSLDSDCGAVKYYCDDDNDGYIAESVTDICLGSGCQPGGCLTNTGNDCDDSDLSVNPGTIEGQGDDPSCSDTKDNDCDGATDSDDTDCAYLDIPKITVTDSVAPTGDLQLPFGDLIDWNSSEQTISIRNNGTGILVIGTIAETNPLDDPFSLQSDNCSGEVLEPSYSCNLTIRFSPNKSGTFNDSFDIPSNDPDGNPVTVSVSGTGLSEITNKQPTGFQLVYPVNKQTGLETTVQFSWKKSKDPEGNSVTYNIYYCNDSYPENCGPIEVVAVSYRLPAYSYAWILLLGIVITRGISYRKRGALLIGIIILSGIIFVSCGEKSSKDEPANEAYKNITTDEVSYIGSGLNTGTTYHWMVIANDGDGEQTKSDIWSFTTE